MCCFSPACLAEYGVVLRRFVLSSRSNVLARFFPAHPAELPLGVVGGGGLEEKELRERVAWFEERVLNCYLQEAVCVCGERTVP